MGGCFSKKVIIGCDHNSYSNEVDEDNPVFKAFAEAEENKGFVDEYGFNFPLATRPEPVSELQISSDYEDFIEAKEDREFRDECRFIFSPSARPEPVNELQISSDDKDYEFENNEAQSSSARPELRSEPGISSEEDHSDSDSHIYRYSMAQFTPRSDESSLSGDTKQQKQSLEG